MIEFLKGGRNELGSYRGRRSLFLMLLLTLSGCASTPKNEGGWFALRWMEKPSPNGPSKLASEDDIAEFALVDSFDHQAGEAVFAKTRDQLREGDVIAYRMGAAEARKKILSGNIASIGYRMFKYGHWPYWSATKQHRASCVFFPARASKART